jgi:hypothetical protein
VKLWVKKDTLFVPVNFRINPDPKTRRRYILSHKWNFGETYRVNIDSAAVRTIYDLPSNKFNTTFKIQDEEHYGSLKIDLQNVTGPTIVQILNTTKDETVLRSYKTDKNGEINFMYLEPQKYVIKAIYDQNKNGKWDPGDLPKKIQPEEVVYFPTVTKVRSNWDNRFPWLLPSGREYTKKIVDPEYEEEKLKNKNKPKNSSRGRAF